MRKYFVSGGLGIAVAVAVGVIVAGASSGSPRKEQIAAPAEDPVGRQLADARAATAKFQRAEEALAAGYVADGFCIASPAGAMGDHYVNHQLMGDGVIDPERPEILLYAKGADGQPRLVAIEYFSPDGDQDLATSSDKPSLFGQQFDGPMPGHSPVMPVHYDLHVWIWENNPAGTFAQFNPSLSCE